MHVHVIIGRTATNTVPVTVRFDITELDAPQVARMVDALHSNNIGAAILVAVADARCSGAALLGLDQLRAALTDSGIVVPQALHTYAITPGTQFTDLDTHTTGTVPDPRNAHVTAETILAGMTVDATRAAIVARFAPVQEIPESVGLAAAARLGDTVLAATLEELAATIHAGEIPSDDLTARTGIALAGGAPEVRDAFLRLALYGEHGAAYVMTHAAARLRGTARARALTVAAFCHYLAGQGPAARIALDAAADAARLASREVPALTALLARVLSAGMPPHQLREIIPAADDVGAATGAHLPG